MGCHVRDVKSYVNVCGCVCGCMCGMRYVNQWQLRKPCQERIDLTQFSYSPSLSSSFTGRSADLLSVLGPKARFPICYGRRASRCRVSYSFRSSFRAVGARACGCSKLQVLCHYRSSWLRSLWVKPPEKDAIGYINCQGLEPYLKWLPCPCRLDLTYSILQYLAICADFAVTKSFPACAVPLAPINLRTTDLVGLAWQGATAKLPKTPRTHSVTFTKFSAHCSG